MAKKWLRRLAALTTAAMLFTMTGCGSSPAQHQNTGAQQGAGTDKEASPAEASKEATADEEDEEVTLKIMFAGPGDQPDTEKVIEAFNAKLTELLPNTKVEIEFVLATQYEERLRLALAAGETIDIADLNSGTGEASNDLVSEAKKGTMQCLDALLETVPELYELIPEGTWERAKVDGQIYMVPINQAITDKFIGIKMQGELADQYCNVDALKQSLEYDNGIVRQETYDILSDYLEKLKENGEIRRGASVETMKWLPQRGYYSLYDWAFVALKEDTENCKVVNYFEQEDVKMMYQYHRDWYKKGYIEQDILSMQDRRQYERKEDGSVLSMTTQFAYDENHPDYDTDVIDTNNCGFDVRTVAWEANYFVAPASSGMQGLIIPNTSAHPERAVKFLSVLNQSKELMTLLSNGIEGEHYERDADGNIQPFVTDEAQARYSGYSWNYGNQLLPDPLSVNGNSYVDYVNEVMMGRAITTPVAGFRLDTEPIKMELAQFDAVRQEYELSLYSGAVENWETLYEEMLDKMKAAGSDKILEEIQRQVDEYLTVNN